MIIGPPADVNIGISTGRELSRGDIPPFTNHILSFTNGYVAFESGVICMVQKTP